MKIFLQKSEEFRQMEIKILSKGCQLQIHLHTFCF